MEDRIDKVIHMAELTKRLIRNEVSPTERDELNDWLQDGQNGKYLRNLFSRKELEQYQDAVRRYPPVPSTKTPEASEILIKKVVPFRKVLSWAASLLLLGILSLYFYQTIRTRTRMERAIPVAGNVISPGSNKATLTLGNGRSLPLNSKTDTNYLLSNSVVHQRGGSIAYDPSSSNQGVEYNTLSTPKGGQWHLTLPDGSEAWLNAASSIRYPTSFKNNAREVEIAGEVFFQIKNAPSAPFIVKAPHTSITVLGTSFNVNAYGYDSTVRTTLVSGAVMITAAGSGHPIYPGQQASTTASLFNVHPVDTFPVTAWKNGYFVFDETPIRQVMKDLENWYDIDVIYADSFKGATHFSGKVSRDIPIANLLEMISQTKTASFDINGKSVIVKAGR